MPDLRGAFPTRTAAGSILLLPLSGAAVALALLPIVTTDLTGYVLPWLDALRSRGASGLSGEFSNYTPPYLYLLYLAGGLAQVVGPVASIKLLNLPFVAAMAATIGLIVCRITGDRHRGLIAGSVLCVTPTVLVNAFAWGQSDCIYATFLLLFLLFASAGRPLAAAAMFGLALSFKAQSLFLAPLLLYLFLSGQMRLRHLLAIPCIYLLMMVPAAMAGRPWKELLTVYYVQALDSAELSVFAANPWWFVGHFHLMSPLAGLIAGILLGGATGLAIALASLMLRRGAGTNLLVAAVSAAALPYVLPRMHDRYFFIADLLTLAMAFAWPRYWLAAVLFQAGSLTSYLAYFGLSATGPGFAVVPMTAGLVLLLSAFREQLDGRPAISLAHVINCAFNPLTINENHGDDS